MPKIVINRCFGGFGLSHEAILRYAEVKGISLIVEDRGDKAMIRYHYYKDSKAEENYFWDSEIERDDPALVQVVEELGEAAAHSYAELKVVEVPDDVDWHIHEYDGRESVHEDHRVWK